MNDEQEATQSNSVIREFHEDVFCDVVSRITSAAGLVRPGHYICRKIPLFLMFSVESKQLFRTVQLYINEFNVFFSLSSRGFSSDFASSDFSMTRVFSARAS